MKIERREDHEITSASECGAVGQGREGQATPGMPAFLAGWYAACITLTEGRSPTGEFRSPEPTSNLKAGCNAMQLWRDMGLVKEECCIPYLFRILETLFIGWFKVGKEG